MPIRDTNEQPRHWFRPESKKYMTVEMEQPFVWPETPSLEPWGQEKRRQEIKEALTSGGLSAEEQRDAARKLSDQAKMLLQKEGPLASELLEKRWAERVELNQSGKEMEKSKFNRDREAKRLSTIELWEEMRTEKVIRSDGPSQFKIKA